MSIRVWDIPYAYGKNTHTGQNNHKFYRVILTLAGFSRVFRGLFPDSFQTKKRHSYDDYSIYMPGFNQFLPAVYPVDVTDLGTF